MVKKRKGAENSTDCEEDLLENNCSDAENGGGSDVLAIDDNSCLALNKDDGLELSVIDDAKQNSYIDDVEKNKTQCYKTTNSTVLAEYIKKVSTFPMLTRAEEERLFNLYLDEGDQKAGQAIVLSHLRLVVKIAMQYKNFGINMMDVIAEGNVGLMIAMQKFDRSKNARFSTYAGLWAKAKIQEFILKSWSIIKVGSLALRKQLLFNFNGLKKILHIDDKTTKKEQSRKIADHFGISESEYENAVSAIRGCEVSLESPVGDGSKNLIDTIGCDYSVVGSVSSKEENSYREKIFRESLSILDERQKDILIARYLNDHKSTLEDLANKYHLSKERVRQIEESAIKKLKKFAEEYKR